ncbi:MAG: hypothetical protein RIC16_00275 [Rhodospirillales bacterium]
MTFRALLIPFLVVFLSGCVTGPGGRHGVFLSGSDELAQPKPVYGGELSAFRTDAKQVIEPVQGAILILFVPEYVYQISESKPEPYCNAQTGLPSLDKLPDVLGTLVAENREYVLYYFCTGIKYSITEAHRARNVIRPPTWISLQFAEEIASRLEMFVDLGVDRKRIIIAGVNNGATSAILATSQLDEPNAGFIALSPALWLRDYKGFNAYSGELSLHAHTFQRQEEFYWKWRERIDENRSVRGIVFLNPDDEVSESFRFNFFNSIHGIVRVVASPKGCTELTPSVYYTSGICFKRRYARYLGDVINFLVENPDSLPSAHLLPPPNFD